MSLVLNGNLNTVTAAAGLEVIGNVLITGTMGVSSDMALNGANLTTTATTVSAFAGATVALNVGGSGATSTVSIPGTLEATSATAASLKTAGGLGVAKSVRILGATSNTAAATGELYLRGGQIGFPATWVPSTDVNTLDDYDEYTSASTACTGAITTAIVWKLTKIGNKVTVTIPAVSGAGVATTNFTVGLAIPVKYRPATNFATVSMPILNNAANQAAAGGFQCDSTTGVMTVWLDGSFSGNFTVTANAGLQFETSVTWTI